MAKRIRAVRLIAGIVLLLLAYITTGAGLPVLLEWSAISFALAVLALLLTFSGIAIFISGVWLILPFGRQMFPLAMGGCGGLLWGALLIAGVLTHVVPCSGPA
jgi:hypothetical protein